jgi:uncharacterized protein (DUF305 family)
MEGTTPMNRALRTLALPTALATVLALAACGSTTDSTSSPASASGGHGMTAMPTMTGRPGTPTGGGSTTGAGRHNDADVRFSTDMIPHHRQAIQMSTMAASRAGTAQVRDLAARIRAAQSPEIRAMSGWLERWGAPVPGTMGGMSMGSTGGMSAAEMTALGRATGPTFDRMFLTGMVQHHQGAVPMARTELARGANADAKNLARSIIESQNREIARMKRLIAQTKS